MNKSVVITGVSSGFGLAIAGHLLGRGYRVYGSVRKPEDAQRLSATLQSDDFVPLLFDVTDHAAVAEAARRVAQELDGAALAGLVNNAGVAPMGPLEHTPIQEMRDAFEVNVFGAMAVTQAFLPLLKQAPQPLPPGQDLVCRQAPERPAAGCRHPMAVSQGLRPVPHRSNVTSAEREAS